MNKIVDLISVAQLLTLGTSLLMLLVFVFAAWLAKRACLRVANQMQNTRKIVWRLFARVAFIAINIIGLISVLGTLGINVSAIVTSLGLTGFALGFAMKDMLSNLIAGIMILLYQPYKLGEKVKIDSFEGTVSDIDLRATTLENDGDKILIPNSLVLSKVVTIY